MPFDSQGQFDVVTDEVLRVLIQARRRLETAWWAGQTRDELSVGRVGERHCIMNAVHNADGSTDAKHQAMDRIALALTGSRHRWLAVWQFNDTKATHDEIKALADRAISARKAELGQ